MKLEAFGSSWKFSAADNRRSSWLLTDTRRGEIIADFKWAKLNNSCESNALSEKCRFHGKLDNSEVQAELQNVYPFGGESMICRTFTLRDRLLEVCVDVKPGKGETVRNFELEEISFCGNYTTLELVKTLPEPDQQWQLEKVALADGTVYCSATPFAVMLLTDEEGFQVELGCGGDWWRMLGCGDTSWSIEKSNDVITVKRRVVALADDVEAERRPWRFNYYLAWGRKSTAISQDKALEITPDLCGRDHGCFRAPAVRKTLRKLIRRNIDSDLQLRLPDVCVCDDAGHLERPNKKSLRHWDWDELFALYSWGNRTLSEDHFLVIDLPENSIFRKFPSYRYLANSPGEAVVREV